MPGKETVWQDGARQIRRRPLHARNRWLHALTYKHVFKCILDEQVIILMEHEKGTEMPDISAPNAPLSLLPLLNLYQLQRLLARPLLLKQTEIFQLSHVIQFIK